MAETISLIKREGIQKLAAMGLRSDRRSLDSMRVLRISDLDIATAEGAAEASLGGTRVIAGIKVSAGEPFPDAPGNGVLITSAELRPMASPSFSAGFPSEESIEVARVVDRGIRESGALDFSKLCLEPGKKVWVVNVDLQVLDYDGNLFDACGIAAIRALHKSVLPFEKLETGERNQKMPLGQAPVPATFVKIGRSIMADPTGDEEAVADVRMTITTTGDGRVCAVQKGGAGSLRPDDLAHCLELSGKSGDSVRAILNKIK